MPLRKRKKALNGPWTYNRLAEENDLRGTNPFSEQPIDTSTAAGQPDVLIVGGGPVGLWTAIQTKTQNHTLQVLVVEKYNTYKRTQELRLDLSVIDNDAVRSEILKKVANGEITQRGGIVRIPVQTLEEILVKEATRLGINIERGKEIKTLQELESDYPNCKVIVGADGSHSNIRKKVFGEDEKAVKREDVQHIVEIKFQVQGKLKRKKESEFMCVSSVRHHSAQNTTDVTLRMFVDKETYDKLGEASFKTPLKVTPAALRSKLSDKLASELDRWTKDEKGAPLALTREVSISKIPLSIYTSTETAKNKKDETSAKKRSYFLVGDSSFAVPYFRALNAGFRSGSHLSGVISSHFSSDKNKGRPVSDDQVDQYNKFMQSHFNAEAAKAKVKNFGVDAKRLLVSVISGVTKTLRKKKEVAPQPLLYKMNHPNTLFQRAQGLPKKQEIHLSPKPKKKLGVV